MHLVRRLAGAAALLGASLALAQPGTPAAGDYVLNDGAWGTLTVRPQGAFEIETVGANAHTCGVKGVITQGKAKPKGSSCEILFTTQGQDVKVSAPQSEACKEFCGMRAWFEGVYKKPPPLCTAKAIAQSRKQFKKDYVAKNYSAALAAINPVATQCTDFLYWVDSAWVMNDLALTQFRLGDKSGCLRTLQGLAADAALSDDGIKQKYPPSDADAYLGVVGATRTNLKLCAKG